jgi:diguanylate cyclase (GGDEF)-like protein
MNPPSLLDRRPVALSSVGALRAPPRPAGAPSRDGQRDAAAAAVLAAQASTRIATALSVAVLQLAIAAGLREPGDPSLVLGAGVVYAGFASLSSLVARRRGRMSPALITVALLVDLAFIFTMTVVCTTSAHYERALFWAMIVAHMANFYFGRRQAWRVVVATVAGYTALVVLTGSGGRPGDRIEQLWSLAIAAGGTGLVITRASDVRRRLRTIVALFERVEEGDFSGTYDEAADRRPDAITRVGRAYNRVRTQLASMVLTDPLTGCLNRRGFDQALAREVSRSARAGSELALLALDLDHFKMINDTHGHPAGDEVLRAAGALLIQAGRAGDVVARTGGEEFAVLLPDTSAAGAFQLASRLCDALREHHFAATDGTPIRLTTSIGVASGAPALDDDFSTLFSERADVALYAAKRSGRDRVRAWSTDLMGAMAEPSR